MTRPNPLLVVLASLALGLAAGGCGGSGARDAGAGEAASSAAAGDAVRDAGTRTPARDEATPPPPSLEGDRSDTRATRGPGGLDRAGIGEIVLAATPLPRGGRVRAAVEVVVGPGLHVNANPPTFDYLIPISVSLEDTDVVRVSEAWYPEAEHRTFPYSEEPYAVYEGSVVVGLELEALADAPAGEVPVTVVLDYQACNDEACFAPARARAPLRVEIGPADAEPARRESPLLARAPFGGPPH